MCVRVCVCARVCVCVCVCMYSESYPVYTCTCMHNIIQWEVVGSSPSDCGFIMRFMTDS